MAKHIATFDVTTYVYPGNNLKKRLLDHAAYCRKQADEFEAAVEKVDYDMTAQEAVEKGILILNGHN